MNINELLATRAALRKQLTEYEAITPCCRSCKHLEISPRCSQFGAEPPLEWLKGPVDCPNWEYDGIPF